MVSVTLSDYLLSVVWWVSLAMLVLLLLMLLQIVRLRVELLTRTAREQHFLQVWKPLMAAAIAEETYTLPELGKGDELFFLKLWNHLQESLRGKAKRRLNIIALRCGMMEQAHLLLRKKNLRSQLLALTTLGHLEDKHDWKDILHLALLSDPLLSFAAARTLFHIDADAALRDLKQQILAREDWQAAQLAILIREEGTENIFAVLADSAISLAGSADPLELSQLNRLLVLLKVAPQQRVIAAIRIILARSSDDETIAQCLKFLSEPSDLPLAQRHVGHPNWVVRLQAANALGRIGAAEDLPRLEKLLSDPVWWVRYRTAQALMALTHGDTQMLAEFRARLTDRYALDMLDMAVEEKKWQ